MGQNIRHVLRIHILLESLCFVLVKLLYRQHLVKIKHEKLEFHCKLLVLVDRDYVFLVEVKCFLDNWLLMEWI